MKPKYKYMSALVIAAIALFCNAPTVRADEIDNYVEANLKELHIPGLSLAIVKDGRVVKSRGYGLANVELNAAATPATVYEIGSLGKQFTATAVMMLAEEGTIGLDDPIAKYFPAAPPSWSGITVRHLLTHTSGIQNHVAVPGYLNIFKTDLSYVTTPGGDELLKEFFKLPKEFAPGETWAYDNTGYYLLGFVIEKVSGKSYYEFLSERIFKPLGMDSTRSTDPRPIVPNRAAGYEWAKGKFENRPVLLPAIAFSAGTIMSTVGDMAKLDNALYTEKLLKRASLEKMWTPAKANGGGLASMDYGFGWFSENYRGHRLLQHSGGTPGFSSVMYRYVDDKLTVIILSNHSDKILDQMAIEIAGMSLPGLKRSISASDPHKAVSLKLKDTISSLLKGQHDPAQFTPAMARYLETSTGKGFWQWFASHGDLNSFSFSEVEDRAGYRVHRYQAGMGAGRYWLSARITKDGKIAQIYWW